MKFLVDTGASLVGLSPDDAKAAGIDPGQLTFNQSVHTANGTVRAAFTRFAKSASTSSKSMMCPPR